MATPRITILGAGFAGLELSTLLSQALGDHQYLAHAVSARAG